MVTFKLIERTDERIIYHYYPEGKENDGFGIIRLNVRERTMDLIKPADDDFETITAKDELNSLRDAINKMRIEAGKPELTEKDLPSATEDEVSRFYANHAIKRIWEAYKDGKILDKGASAWY